jgi:hypothetical protein
MNGGEEEYIQVSGGKASRWVENVMMCPGKIGWGGMDWNGLAEGKDRKMALVNTLNLRLP